MLEPVIHCIVVHSHLHNLPSYIFIGFPHFICDLYAVYDLLSERKHEARISKREMARNNSDRRLTHTQSLYEYVIYTCIIILCTYIRWTCIHIYYVTLWNYKSYIHIFINYVYYIYIYIHYFIYTYLHIIIYYALSVFI